MRIKCIDIKEVYYIKVTKIVYWKLQKKLYIRFFAYKEVLSEVVKNKNIKSFVDSKEIEIIPITVFVGRNSSGKSSLIRFPVVLSQTATADNDSPIKFYGTW